MENDAVMDRKEHKKRMRQNQKQRKVERLQEIFSLIASNTPELSAGLADSGECLENVIADLFKPIQNR